ncbi:phosphoribosylformylglycinamidine synthase subunit PurQ [Sphingomonas daechungensis]|uniref:phosphoribosylformylglycinamidine synthase subunit PurQ n=1 Tax=Sphingomonas daechungensis TaxID=1176646 RepID=UPI00378347DA
MKSAIVVFPGSNRENDAADALERASGSRPALVWHKDSVLPDGLDLIVLPGGFSYGDYLRCGAMAARSPIMREVIARADKGTAVVGVCNGFQILCEAGLLPGVLLSNAGLKFICRDVHLKVANSQTMFTHRYSAGQVVRFPVAHHDGNYFADPDTLKRLEDGDQVAFRYCTPDGDETVEGNPNGSIANIAGVFNATKTVLGLMPHPENATDPATVSALGGSLDGQAMFDAIVDALSK